MRYVEEDEERGCGVRDVCRSLGSCGVHDPQAVSHTESSGQTPHHTPCTQARWGRGGEVWMTVALFILVAKTFTERSAE